MSSQSGEQRFGAWHCETRNAQKTLADGNPISPSRAIRKGCRGNSDTGRKTSGASCVQCSAKGPNSPRHCLPSWPRRRLGCRQDRAPESRQSHRQADGLPARTAESTPAHNRCSGSVEKNGEASAIGCTADPKSCRNPGSVSGRVRAPPPGCGSASNTSTRSPACASTMAAARPFGPAPITTARRSFAGIGRSVYANVARQSRGASDYSSARRPPRRVA